MKEPIFVMLMGLPGSGKSTFRDKINLPNSHIVISSDDLIEEHASRHQLTYNDVFANAIKWAEKEAINDLKWATHHEHNIVVDRTNLSVKSRAKILRLVPDTYYKVACVVMCDEADRQFRLTRRPGKVIPAHIDISMRDNWAQPSAEEGFDLITSPHNFLDEWL